MSTKLNRLFRSWSFWFYGGGLLVVAAGFAGGILLKDEVGIHSKAQIAAHVSNEIGLAVLIALILALTFDRRSAQEFRALAIAQMTTATAEFAKLAEEEKQVIKRDVFYYVLGHRIPESVTAEIDTQILKVAFLRRNVVMSYWLEPYIDQRTGTRYMRIEFTMTYQLENITSEVKQFSIRSTLDKPPHDWQKSEAKYVILNVSSPRHQVELRGTDIPAHWSGDSGELVLEYPIEVVPGENPLVTICSESIAPFENGFDYVNLINLTCDVELTVHVQDCRMKISSRASGTNALAPTPLHRPDQGYYHWKSQRPFLPYQTVYVLWEPQPAEPSTTQPVAGQAIRILTEVGELRLKAGHGLLMEGFSEETQP